MRKEAKKGVKDVASATAARQRRNPGRNVAENALLDGGTVRVVAAPSLHRVAVPALHVAAVERRPCQLGGRRTVR